MNQHQETFLVLLRVESKILTSYLLRTNTFFYVLLLVIAFIRRYSLSLAGTATSIIFVVTKVKGLKQKCACCDTIMFVATNICRDHQKKNCRDKTFVTTKDVFCRAKHVSAPANDNSLLSSRLSAHMSLVILNE